MDEGLRIEGTTELHRRPVARSSAEVLWALVALLSIAMVGGLKLLTPFDGDQALFLYMAAEIDRGARLYVDVWDVKQPGIIWFYWLAGKLFGFSMVGIKLGELCWMLAFAATIIALLRRYLIHPWLSSVAAMAALLSYYTFASAQELTQLEMLVAFPMFVSAWLLVREASSPAVLFANRLIAGGLAGACVVFKLPYAPIFIFLVLLAILERIPAGSLSARLHHAATVLLPYVCGVAITLGATTLILWTQAVLDEAVWISFVFPFLSLDQVQSEAPLGRLLRNLKWYGVALFPWLVFAALTLPRLPRRTEPALTRQMAGWIIFAILLIVLQKHSFWRYHFFLLFVPGAVLAARGIDLLLSRVTLSAGRRTAGGGARASAGPSPMVLSLFLVLPALGAVVFSLDRQVQDFYQALFSRDRIGLEGYRRQLGKDYDWVVEKFSPLRPAGGVGEPIYVLGNPLAYLISGRRQALPVHGWSWEMLPASFWRDLPAQLDAARPAYVFLGRFYRRIFPLRPPYGPATVQYLDEHYQVLWDEEPVGRLYQRRDPPPDQGFVADLPPLPDPRVVPGFRQPDVP